MNHILILLGIPRFLFHARCSSFSTILWSVVRVPELPLSTAEGDRDGQGVISLRGALADIKAAIIEMPPAMRQLALAMLCQWYAMFAYWQFIAFALARSLHGTADVHSHGFREATLTVGQAGAFYNGVAFVSAFALVPLTRRLGARSVHAGCLAASGVAMLAIPLINLEPWLYLAMIGIGLGWASMMGNPYVMLTDAIPPHRFGIYMGIFNMFIVVPMIIESISMSFIYRSLLGGDPRNVLFLGGVLMLVGGLATLRVKAGVKSARLAQAKA